MSALEQSDQYRRLAEAEFSKLHARFKLLHDFFEQQVIDAETAEEVAKADKTKTERDYDARLQALNDSKNDAVSKAKISKDFIDQLALHLNRNPTWAPKAWDEVLDPQEWLMCATPLKIASSPEVSAQESEEFLAEISRTIPRVAGDRNTIARPPGAMESDVSANSTVTAPESPIRKAVRMYFKEAKTSEAGLSAREWWAANPIVLGGIKEEFWLLRVLAEHDNKGKSGAWSLRLFSTQDDVFDGNVLINDVRVCKRVS